MGVERGWVARCVLLIATLASGCTDPEGLSEGCPEGVAPGAVLECRCGGDRGVQRCEEDGTLGGCACSDIGNIASSPTDGGRRDFEDGGRVVDGGSRALDGGSHALDSGSRELDAGSRELDAGGRDGGRAVGRTRDSGVQVEPPATDAGADAGSAAIDSGDPTRPPRAGAQLSLCDEPSDCDADLSCYDTGPGQGFCTRTCKGDADCVELEGADYTCSADGLCEIDCGGPAGGEKCPEGLICVQISGSGGAGGVRKRCNYAPASTPDA